MGSKVSSGGPNTCSPKQIRGDRGTEVKFHNERSFGVCSNQVAVFEIHKCFDKWMKTQASRDLNMRQPERGYKRVMPA